LEFLFKSIEDGRFIFGIDESTERHRLEKLDVPVLVWFMVSVWVGLHFKHGPCAFPQNNEIRDALDETRVVLHDEATRESALDTLLQPSLVLTLECAVAQSIPLSKRRNYKA